MQDPSVHLHMFRDTVIFILKSFSYCFAWNIIINTFLWGKHTFSKVSNIHEWPNVTIYYKERCCHHCPLTRSAGARMHVTLSGGGRRGALLLVSQPVTSQVLYCLTGEGEGGNPSTELKYRKQSYMRVMVKKLKELWTNIQMQYYSVERGAMIFYIC